MNLFELPPPTPGKLAFAWKIYQVCFAAIEEYCALRHAEATHSWVAALRRAEVGSRTWDMEARRFREAPDSATLMHTYYRGLPHMIVQMLATGDTIARGDTDWAVTMADQAGEASALLARAIGGDRDRERVHRLQVFPMIAAIQGNSTPVDPNVVPSAVNRPPPAAAPVAAVPAAH